MALDPTALEQPDASPNPTDDISQEVAPVEAVREPSTEVQEPVKPPTYTAEEWFASPEYQSRKDKEHAAWEKKRADDIAKQSAEAALAKAEADRADLVRRAYELGDTEAQAKLAEDAYHGLVRDQATSGFRAQWMAEADATTKAFANGDPELEQRFNVRSFNTVTEWTQAMADHKATEAVKAAEAQAASARAIARNDKPNPDTAEMVGGHGGPIASLSMDELNARYAKAKDDGNTEEVVRLRSVLHQRMPVMAGRR